MLHYSVVLGRYQIFLKCLIATSEDSPLSFPALIVTDTDSIKGLHKPSRSGLHFAEVETEPLKRCCMGLEEGRGFGYLTFSLEAARF